MITLFYVFIIMTWIIIYDLAEPSILKINKISAKPKAGIIEAIDNIDQYIKSNWTYILYHILTNIWQFANLKEKRKQ